jgi:hypothetical protein
VTLSLFALSCPRPAVAEIPRQRVQLIYQAPESCPAEDEFRRRVEARLADQALESAGREPQLSLRVELRPESSVAFVSFEDHERKVARTVSGGSCDELATAAAVIAAVTLGARDETPVDAAPATPENDSESPTPETATPASEVAGETRALPPHTPAASPAAPAREPPALDAERERREWEAGAGAFVATWPLRSPEAGLDVFVRASTSWWSARASAIYLRASTRVGERSADFSLWGGRAEGCPLAMNIGARVRGELCLVLEAGALRGRGDESSALLNATSVSVPWCALEVPARLRLSLGAVVRLEAQGEIGVPLTRPAFVFEGPRETIVTPPSVGFSGRFGVGVTFL